MGIGENIKKLRIEHGLDQAQLGEIAGVSDKAVSTWENNISIPRMGAIQKMADYFGVTKSVIIEEAPNATLSYGGSDEKLIKADDFTYAMFEEAKDLTDEQKEALLAMARAFKNK